MSRVDKNRPPHEWIEDLRRRFPCEAEIDRILTRKLQRRAGPPYTPVSLDTLVQGTQALIRSQHPGDFEILEAKWLNGGASKLQMAFKLRWNEPGVGATVTPMVLRMEPSESITETSRLREFQIIKALSGTLPVPPTYWVDSEGQFLPYPAIVYGFAEGVTKPSTSSSNVSGVGTIMPPQVRASLGPQFVEHLATLHTFDWRQAELSAFSRPAPGTQAIEWKLNQWERIWEEDVHEDVPLMRLALAWLRQNMPVVDHVSVVHGDYRVGNFLYTEHDQRISSWLDWELSYLGDRHEDLAWCTKSVFGHPDENGQFLVGGLMPKDQFFAAYEQASGLKVKPEALKFYDIFGNYKSVVICLATGIRVARNGKSHQDIVVSWLSGISYALLEELRTQLEEVL